MNKPSISIVMPTWNRGSVIQHAIRSILGQDFKDFELIIVDDGSTDNTERVVKNFEDPRIRYYRIPHCGKISVVRNHGNKLAKGELIVVQDSDDISFPDRLERIWNAYQESKADVIYHDMYVRSYDPYHNAVMYQSRVSGPYTKERMIHEQYIPGQVAYKRDVILKIPYDERITCCDDFQILIELALNNCSFSYIDRPLYEYIVMSDSVNVQGEIDGRRFEDTRIIISILKEKYNIKAVGELKKWETMTGKIIKKEKVDPYEEVND